MLLGRIRNLTSYIGNRCFTEARRYGYDGLITGIVLTKLTVVSLSLLKPINNYLTVVSKSLVWVKDSTMGTMHWFICGLF